MRQCVSLHKKTLHDKVKCMSLKGWEKTLVAGGLVPKSHETNNFPAKILCYEEFVAQSVVKWYVETFKVK